MNNKIKNYVDVLFADVPRSKKAKELKDEILANLSDRFDDYTKQGHSENQAYSMVVSNIGDIDSLIDEVMPDANFKEQANWYRKRNAKNTAIGVSMYILGAAFLIGFGALGDFMHMGEFFGVIGLLCLLLLCAIATGLIVYTNMSTPIEYKDFDEDEARDRKLYSSKNGNILKGFMGIYWSLVLFVYLALSFVTGAWHISWIIWVIAGIFGNIIKIIWEMRNLDE